MTGQEICEAWIRKQKPEASDEEVARLALEFWNASPTGEIDHVFAAQAELELDEQTAPSPAPAGPAGTDPKGAPMIVWAVYSAMLDGDGWIHFELVSIHAAPPPGMVITTREAFGSSGDQIPEGLGPLPMAYSHVANPEVRFVERLEVLP
jgi:hypothetical protein